MTSSAPLDLAMDLNNILSFEGAAVNKRYSIMDPIEVFTNTSFEERNDIYVREVIDLGEKVLEKALQKANWKP